MASIKANKQRSGILGSEGPQKPHLLGHGTSAEVRDLRNDVLRAFEPLVALAVDEFSTPASGSTLLLTHKPRTRAGKALILLEVVDGVVLAPPTGVIATTAGESSYVPATPPNGAHHYAVYYEPDTSGRPSS